MKIFLDKVAINFEMSEDAHLYISTEILVHRWSFTGGDLVDSEGRIVAEVIDPGNQDHYPNNQGNIKIKQIQPFKNEEFSRMVLRYFLGVFVRV